jgi:uridylate kinase
MLRPVFKRVLLKLSGEAFLGEGGGCFDPVIVNQIADEIKEVHEAGVGMGIVIGGGNIYRGASGDHIGRAEGDAIGMLATAINSLVLGEFLARRGIDVRVLSAIDIPKTAELFTSRRGLRHLAKNRIVIIAGGTGNPFFTTDTAAALRCLELQAEVILKATKVDGIYDSDPVKNPGAKKFGFLTHAEALRKNLKIMDAAAFSLCMEHGVPIIVFKLLERGNLRKCIEGLPIGTIVKKGE